MWKNKWIANIAAGAVLCGALVYYNFIDKPIESVVVVGEECPDFIAKPYVEEDGDFSLGNDVFQLSKQRGKVCIVNFWGTWCIPCIQELPDFNRIQEEYAESVSVVAIVVASPPKNGVDSTAEWMTNKGWTKYDKESDWAEFSLTLAYLPMAECGKFGATGPLPRTFIMDEEGIISFETDESMHYEELKKKVDELL